jgi:hydrogenase nickel incorporation protein HypB
MNAQVVETTTREAEPAAKQNREALRGANVFAVNVVGGPGCGKTTLIDATVERLRPGVRVGVISCDPGAPHRPDAGRAVRHGARVAYVNITGRETPDANDVRAGIESLDLDEIDVLFIENVGTMTGAVASVDLGQRANAAVFSVAGGDDKAGKHEPLVRGTDVVVLNKTFRGAVRAGRVPGGRPPG